MVLALRLLASALRTVTGDAFLLSFSSPFLDLGQRRYRGAPSVVQRGVRRPALLFTLLSLLSLTLGTCASLVFPRGVVRPTLLCPLSPLTVELRRYRGASAVGCAALSGQRVLHFRRGASLGGIV
jgi:hypothetical protein